MSDFGVLDKTHCWHPFTQHAEWCAPDYEPLVLVEGRGAMLRDSDGREYIDGNSSIWTNIHGHRHPRLDAALKRQIDRVAHTSFLGFTNPPAAQLASELCAFFPAGSLTRCFFSDDGSTAVEVALKMAAQYWQLSGRPEKRKFVAFTDAYHGDTMGASSLGGIALFHGRFGGWHFPAEFVDSMETLAAIDPRDVAGVIIEPLIQGAAGMKLWPSGMLARLRDWCRENEVLLILDEVMTGFGRTGKMFACEHESVVPDFIALAKGLTAGYLPLAATLATERVFSAFVGGVEKTLFYGHSYTGNQLGCSVALESLAIFRDEDLLTRLQTQINSLATLLDSLREHPRIGEIRQCGFIAGIDLRGFPTEARTGARLCFEARKYGLLTRPIRDTIILMPPYCITQSQLEHAISAIRLALDEITRP
jgi:adenosylmethionine-8-amino-7-oxononanoate aminotransferase